MILQKRKLEKPNYKPTISNTNASKFSSEFSKLKSSNYKPNFIDFNNDIIDLVSMINFQF